MSLQAALLGFISRERAASWRNVLSTYELPVEDRVEKGECIADLSFKEYRERNGTQVLVFHAPVNDSKFRTGDGMILSNGNDVRVGSSCEFIDYDPLAHEVLVAAGFRSLLPDVKPELAYCLDRDGMDLYDQLAKAVNWAYTDGPNGPNIRAIVERTIIPTRRKAAVASAEQALAELQERLGANRALNPSQQSAFVAGLASDQFALIQGPPGTGKTYLVAQIVEALLADGKSVLISALTHRAINNVLNMIARTTRVRGLVKIGRPHEADGLHPRIRLMVTARGLDNPGPGLIVGATSYGALRLVEGGGQFDVVIFDEAGQVTLPLAITGMLAGRRYIFVGDHQQMPPVVQSIRDEEGVTGSIFEWLIVQYPSVMLEETYRMNAEINAFSSNHFYQGRLRPAEWVGKARLPLRPGGRFWDLLDPEVPSVFALIRHLGRQMHSPEEAVLVGNLVVELVSHHGHPASEIAVVAPYRAQVRAIKSAITRVASMAGVTVGPELLVETVERIQGQERDVVIISFACSDPDYLRSEADFFFMPNRLNVAVTRPRVKRILVGSPEAFTYRPRSPELLRYVNAFKRLLRETPQVDYTSRIPQL